MRNWSRVPQPGAVDERTVATVDSYEFDKDKQMLRFDVQTDLAGVPGLEPGLSSAATVYVPEALSGPVNVIVGYPGSGFTRGYFDIQDKPGYSEAAYHVERGLVFVACDHVGIGDSTPCDIWGLTLESMAAANHATATNVLDRLRAGTLSPDLAPVEIASVTGTGQSMGGCLLTVQQANHRTFDAVVMLGWSAIHENLPHPDGSRIVPGGVPRDFDLTTLAEMGRHDSQEVGQDRELVTYGMHWREDDPDLVALSLANIEGDPDQAHTMPSWRILTLPACCAQMLSEGVVAPEAAAIDVPVLICAGVIDCVPDPQAEPEMYSKSPDVRVVVMDRMAHMHNFSQVRADLWDHVREFATSVPDSASNSAKESVEAGR